MKKQISVHVDVECLKKYKKILIDKGNTSVSGELSKFIEREVDLHEQR